MNFSEIKKAKIIVVALALCVIGAQLLSAQQVETETSVPALLNRAYEMLSSNPAGAVPLFERVVVLEPSNLLARRQLGYLYQSQEKPESALVQFQASENIHSSDSIKLQIAYLLISLHRTYEGRKVFDELSHSSNPMIKEQAKNELDASLPDKLPSTRTWVRFYADPYYDTRWNSTFIHFNFQDGYYFSEAQKVGGYGVIALSADTRSNGGTVPLIISDNTLLVGFGFRFNPLYGLSGIIQEGAAFDLIRTGSEGNVKNDFRIVATYGNGFYAPFNLHSDVRFPFTPFVDLYSSLGYYSRYKNVIGDLQLKAGVRAVEVSHTVVDVYAVGALVRDTEQEFYNNVLEGGLGIRCTPSVNCGLHLIGEYRRGNYWDVSDKTMQARASLYNQSYDSFRFMVVIEHLFR